MEALLGAVYLLSGLVVLAHACLQLDLWRATRAADTPDGPAEPAAGPAPGLRVVVQLPVYNEPDVVEGLLDSVAGQVYPQDLWSVQVLDDSTDETSALVAGWLARRAEGATPAVSHLRRTDRSGYKAGALQYGLDRCPHADLVAVLDADFRPPPDFLCRAVGGFAEADVAVVQGRWGHLNAAQNWLTRALAVMLDNHFEIEQRGRQAMGAFRAFNGSAGVIRVSALRGVGGWRADTLTEDFDLSLRLQFAGWRIAYDPDLVVPAELPATISSLRIQQHRWMRGVAQNIRCHLRDVARARLALRTRAHLLGQLVETAVFVAMGAQLLLAPLVALAASHGRISPAIAMNLPLALGFLSLLPVYVHSMRGAGGTVAERVRRYAGFVLLSSAFTLHNAVAVVAGWIGGEAEFERTPKAGPGDRRPSTAGASLSRLPVRSSWPLAFEVVLSGVTLASCLAVLVLRPGAAGYLWPVVGWLLGCLVLVTSRLGSLRFGPR